MSNADRHTVFPLAVAMLGMGTYAGMDAVMKGLSIGIGAYNAMFWRTLIALVIAAGLFAWKQERWPQQSAIRVHVWRGVVTSVMAFLFFWGLVRVPLAEAVALTFIAPLIALYLAALLLKEEIGAKAIFASVVGLAGALVIIGGKLGGDYSHELGQGITAILCSALLYAYNLILQRQQALIARPVEIAFFQSLTVVSLYLLPAPFLAVVPAPELLPGLVVAAVLGIVSLLLIAWAYARAEARILIPVEYTAFVWAALLGFLVFGEAVTAATSAGTAMIVIGCLVASRQQHGRVDHVETTAV
jgi:S-adenosylmethionine uptake transporter